MQGHFNIYQFNNSWGGEETNECVDMLHTDLYTENESKIHVNEQYLML